ncbi:MAG: hypothetical protein FWC43_14545 [Planctomycetaceae bacterium]|nr:hypothetical protein [Planctomycetaceae bacterium]
MNFGDQLKNSMGNIRKKANARVRRIALAAFERISTASPVDEGTFRANWLVSFNTLDRDFDLNLTLADVPESTTKAVAFINARAVAGIDVFICNSVPYAVALEYGYSSQASGGVVGPVCQLMQLAISAGSI